MMATTHAVIGIVGATSLSLLAPTHIELIALSGFIGGILPDLDIAFNHRKTFHYPVYSTAAALLMTGAAILWTTPATLVTAALLIGVALHALSDIVGGDFTNQPWKNKGTRAVYNHFTNKWLSAKRHIQYDGAPEDLLLYLVIAIPLLFIHTGLLFYLILGSTVISITYTAFRKELNLLSPGTVHDPIDIKLQLQALKNQRF